MTMNSDWDPTPDLQLLQKLIFARGPVGEEDEVADVCREALEPICDAVWRDPSGNLVARMGGREEEGEAEGEGGNAIRLLVHMDEISMVVKRIEPDGRLRVLALGGMKPGNFGQGPVDILADSGIVPGILSLGPVHSTMETQTVAETRERPIRWEDVRIFTRLSPERLQELGVHPGTRVVLSRNRRQLFIVEDCVGSHFMDDRVMLLVLLQALQRFNETGRRPRFDVYAVATAQEEMTNYGASYASRTLPGNLSVALEVGPVAQEYTTMLNEQPIIAYGDDTAPYSRSLVERLREVAGECGLDPQLAYYQTFRSDASAAIMRGQAARAAMLCIPTENTHGFEIVARDGITNCIRMLHRYLDEPVEEESERDEKTTAEDLPRLRK